MAILHNAGNRRPPSHRVRMLVGVCGTAAVALLGTLHLTAASDRHDTQISNPQGVSIQPLVATPPADTAVRPHDDAHVETAPRTAQASSWSPAPPRTIEQMIAALPDFEVDFDPNHNPQPDPVVRPAPQPNPRPTAQLKGAPSPLAPEVSEETRRRVVEALQTALADDDEGVRVQALLALTGLADERAIPGLLKAARDASPRVRMAAVRALAQFSTTAAIDALTTALKDTEAEVRQQAARALGQIARGQRGAKSVPPIPPIPPAPPVAPSPALPGASIVPPTPPRVRIDLDRIDDIVAQAQQDARRVLEEFGRNRQEIERQQQELERQREELQRQLR